MALPRPENVLPLPRCLPEVCRREPTAARDAAAVGGRGRELAKGVMQDCMPDPIIDETLTFWRSNPLCSQLAETMGKHEVTILDVGQAGEETFSPKHFPPCHHITLAPSLPLFLFPSL
jgi:hypothetical protein